jgi:DNA damage-binding protein 1
MLPNFPHFLYVIYLARNVTAFSITFWQDNKDARHVKTYEVALKEKDFVEGPWSQNSLDNGADLLIPVPPPLCGVLIIGEETIVYCSANGFKAIPIRPVC